MNLKFLVISLAIIALLVPESDAFWSRRRRRRRRRRPKPPPGPSQHCRNQVNLYSVIRGNNLHQLARVWAPAVKLAQGETWKPSSVDFFLRHVNVVGGPNPQPLRPNNLPTCNRNCYLKSKGRLNCASCTNLPFLHGEHPSKVPVYTTIVKKGSEIQFVYRFFFPYNRGKRVCVGLHGGGRCPCPKTPWGCPCPRIYCVGGYSTFGQHVGDWEHMKIVFRNNRLHSMFLSTHNSAITNKHAGTFLWNGLTFQKGHKKLKLEGCTHGVAYAALGSHGFWPNVGNHVYKNLPNGEKLVDKCSHGEAWNTWNTLKIVDQKPRGQYTGDFKFLNFNGRWGNRERGCGLAKKVLNVCILEHGPQRS
ncbi:uncharacterized protein LOC110233834 [Exaiptasia diaphana]|uniref:Uncharacterized protein n=1 Tax=Exaiptasia diaphana TaxID=2652724 RepID=A0A913WVN1_EXADI|nr:uncharacterized protein LOC110233834 [Exaiptasia diaphana]